MKNGDSCNAVKKINEEIIKKLRDFDTKRTIFLPYCKGISEQVSRVCEKHKFNTCFKPS